jgi:hypothetical protein
MAITRVVQTILSGDDIDKIDFVLINYSRDEFPSVSSVIRHLIVEEYNKIKLSTSIIDTKN